MAKSFTDIATDAKSSNASRKKASDSLRTAFLDRLARHFLDASL